MFKKICLAALAAAAAGLYFYWGPIEKLVEIMVFWAVIG